MFCFEFKIENLVKKNFGAAPHHIIIITKQIIEQLASICWNPSNMKQIIKDLQKKYKKKEFEKLINYYTKEYSDYIEDKLLDYHHQLQSKIAKNPTWVEFIEGLK